MVNQQCGNCKKVISGILEVCNYCKATKESNGFDYTYWVPYCEPTHSYRYISGTCPDESERIYGTCLGKVDMTAQERVAEAQRQLELAQKEFEKEQKTDGLSREARAVFEAFNQFGECEITRDEFIESYSGPYAVIRVNLKRTWTGCLSQYTELVNDYGLYVGNVSSDDKGDVILHFFKR